MTAVSLLHIAILTTFAAANAAATNTDLRAAETHITGRYWSEEPTEPTVEKVVLRENTLSEKYGIGTDPVAPPDAETIALINKASHFVSSIDWIAKRKDPPPAKPDFPIRANWTKRFVAEWDDDGGFTLGGKYVPSPPPDDPQIFSFIC